MSGRLELELVAVICDQCGTTTLYTPGRQIDGPRTCPACSAPLAFALSDRHEVVIRGPKR